MKNLAQPPFFDEEVSEKEKLKNFYSTPTRPLEANEAFPQLTGSPNEPQTTYKSSQFSDSFLFPWNPDDLASGNNYDIYDEMKNDEQIKAALSFKKDIVVNSGWRIVCEEQEIKEFVEKCLNEKLDMDETGKTFDDILRDIMSSYDYGFSISEPVYRLNKDNLYEYKSVKVRPPHTFEFEIDRYGKIITILQHTDQSIIKLDPKKFIHHVYQQEFGNPYGKSDLKSAYAAWKAKKFFMRFFAIYIERFAGPVIKGTYKSGLDVNEIARIHNVLKTIQNSTVLALPDDLDVEFIMSQRDASDAYVKGLDMFNLWISRALLVPDLIGISGDKTSGGSYSLGKTQFKMFLNTIEKDRKSLSNKITLKLIRPLVESNFGDYDVKFEFLPIPESEEIEYSKLWSDFMRSNIVKPTDEELNHFRRSVKFPEVESSDFVNKSMDDTSKEENKIEEDKTENDKEEFSLKHFRELNQYEKVVNFAQIKKNLDESENKISPKLRLAGKAIINDYVDQVKSKGLIRNFQPEKVNELQPKFMRDMNVLFRNYFTDLFKENYSEAQQEILPTSTKKFTDAELLPEEFIEIVEAESFKNVGDYVNEITKKGKNVLVNGIKAGESESSIAKRMKEEMEDASEKWIRTVVRTKTTEMFNTARKTYWETDEIASQLVEAYQFSAILDDRTSDVCRELDSKIFEKGDYSDQIVPPLHFNCRSILVPITKFQDYETDKEISIDKLKSLGGNLIFSQKKDFDIYSPNIRISGRVNLYGDTLIITSPGANKYIRILGFHINNASPYQPVVAGFRMQDSKEIRYRTNLEPNSAPFNKSFDGLDQWILENNRGLMINLSAPVEVDYTLEYQVLNKNGARIK